MYYMHIYNILYYEYGISGDTSVYCTHVACRSSLIASKTNCIEMYNSIMHYNYRIILNVSCGIHVLESRISTIYDMIIIIIVNIIILSA